MARPIRIQYPGAVYHVMARGNHGQKIFADDADRKTFLSALAEACAKTGWRIHAFTQRTQRPKQMSKLRKFFLRSLG